MMSLSKMEENKLLALRTNRRVTFVRPEKTVPLSVTGSACALNCKHCNRHYLEHMLSFGDEIPADTKSILLSGGANLDGVVDLEPYRDQIVKLKQKYRINSHLGLIDEVQARQLITLLDVVSFDFPSSERVIHQVYNLDKNFENYVTSYKVLRKFFPVEVHLTLGLEFGEIVGELDVLRKLVDLGVKELVLNILIPTPATQMAKVDPPNLEEVAKVFELARELFDTLALGCMRPGGHYREEIDLLALRLGFDIIVQPTRKVREVAVQEGCNVRTFDECCAFLLANS